MPGSGGGFRSGCSEAHIPGMERWTRIAELAAKQHGVVSLEQLRAEGWTESMIRRALGRGQLRRVGSRAFAMAGAPETWRMSLQAGLLDLGSNAAVAGRSAAALLGFDNFAEGPVELLVPRRGADAQGQGGGAVDQPPSVARRDRRARRLPVHERGAHHRRPGGARGSPVARGRHRQCPPRRPHVAALPPSPACSLAAPRAAGDGAPGRNAHRQRWDHTARAPVPAAGAARRSPPSSLPDDASSGRPASSPGPTSRGRSSASSPRSRARCATPAPGSANATRSVATSSSTTGGSC